MATLAIEITEPVAAVLHAEQGDDELMPEAALRIDIVALDQMVRSALDHVGDEVKGCAETSETQPSEIRRLADHLDALAKVAERMGAG